MKKQNINKLDCFTNNFLKQSRLRKPKDFSLVYKDSVMKTFGDYFLVLVYYQESKQNSSLLNSSKISKQLNINPRMGVVVSKKVSKLAITRNRIKRVVRENFRQIENAYINESIVIDKKNEELGENFDFVIIAKYQAAKINNKKLDKDLDILWKKSFQKCREFLLK